MMNKLIKTHKRAGRAAVLGILLSMLALLAACRAQEPEDGDQIDLSDPSGTQGITTAAQLLQVVAEGKTDTITLAASIDLGEEMLRMDAENASLTIIGNGFTVSGNGDCVIRLAKGCSLTLEDVTLNGGASAIGCLGNAGITGEATIKAIANSVHAMGKVTFGEGSRFFITSNVGSGVNAQGLELLNDARVRAEGALGGIAVLRDDVVLNAGSVLDANTKENYNALKCEGTLVMRDGAKLIANNEGEYHGAEVFQIAIEGTVTIEARGGSKGVGLFLFALEQTDNVIGFCEPELRFEVGEGSLAFYESAAEFPVPEETATPQASPEG